MNRPKVFSTTADTPSSRISSRLHPIATITGLRSDHEELVTTAVRGSAANFNLQRLSQTRSQRIRGRRFVWFRVQPALSMGGIAATPEPVPRSSLSAGGVGDRAASASAVASLPTTPLSAAALPATPLPTATTDPLASDFALPAPAAEPPLAEEPTPAAAPAPKPPSAISRVELTIDSLRTYDLIRPIPVVVESLGERNYVAEMPDLNISISASNPSEIIITLKDRIAQVYDSLRILKHLDAEQARQLRVLESYIAKSRRGWLDRR